MAILRTVAVFRQGIFYKRLKKRHIIINKLSYLCLSLFRFLKFMARFYYVLKGIGKGFSNPDILSRKCLVAL